MREHERTRERSREEEQLSWYEVTLARYAARRERAETGTIVIRAKDLPWQQNRQGRLRYYLDPEMPDVALDDWQVFGHHIQTHSGRHTHQGGVVIYVMSGRGHTVTNGQKQEWKAGDLILLPVVPGGCEHQHFNDDSGEASQWVGFQFAPWQYAMGAEFTQQESSPNWRSEQ